jgi:hypothetical protein
MNKIKRLFIGIFSLVLALDLIAGVRADLAPGPLVYMNPIMLVIILIIIALITYLILRIIRKKKSTKR